MKLPWAGPLIILLRKPFCVGFVGVSGGLLSEDFSAGGDSLSVPFGDAGEGMASVLEWVVVLVSGV